MIAREAGASYAGTSPRPPQYCLLDTSVVVGVLRRHAPSREAVRKVYEDLRSVPVISAVVRYELERGVGSADGRRRLEAFLHGTDVWPLTGTDAAVAASVDRSLRGRRLGIGDVDTLIAGSALARGCPVLTHNVRHFARVPGLTVWDAGG